MWARRAGWEEAAKGFSEIPKGRSLMSCWYSPAVRVVRPRHESCHPSPAKPGSGDSAAQVVPLYVAIGAATFICGGYMIKHFGGHTDVCFAKSLRTDADHNGKSQHRLNTHNGHFGMRSVNKTSLSVFPFKFTPMDSALTPPPSSSCGALPSTPECHRPGCAHVH